MAFDADAHCGGRRLRVGGATIMTKWLLAFLWIAFAMAGADTAHAQDRWARIGSVTASASAQQVIIDTSAWTNGCKGIQIAVSDGTIAIEHISIVYTTGRVVSENLSTPVRVAPGGRSRVFAPTDEARAIRLVTVRFSRVDRSANAATIEVWGLQPSVSPKARDVPTAQRRQFKFEQPTPRSAEPPPPPPPPPPIAQPEQTPASRSARPSEPRSSVETSREAARPSAPRTRSLTSPPPAAEPPTASGPARAPEPQGGSVPVADKPYSEIDVFFGTDRKREADRSKFGRSLASFGAGRSAQLTLGKAVVTVPKEGRGKGSIPRPEWDLVVVRFSLRTEDLAKDFTVFAVDVLDRKTFIQQARDKLATSQRFKGQAFVFVHGYFVTFDDALFRAAQIAHDLEFDGAPFVFSWPSVAGVTGYVLDRGRARDARDQLRDFVDLIGKETGATEVHLIAHSMGADPLLEVLRDISRSEPQVARGTRPRFGEIILAAPDVTRESFELIASQITGLRRGMTLYASSNDRALAASRFTRLGESPAGYVPTSGPVVVPGAADTIDISSLDTSFFGVNHSTFADREALLGDIRRLIANGLRPPSTRGPEFHLIQGEGGAYWRYTK
jgi:esterase/lipase superfamily enzyme